VSGLPTALPPPQERLPMKCIFPRPILAALAAGLLLAGCASHPARTGATKAGNSRAARSETTPAPAVRSGESHANHGNHATTTSAPEPSPNALPEDTGIPACDDYLASYVACHRAAAIYKPDQLQGRYEAMRTSLLRDSQDPATRPTLAARCNALASQLRQALHGKSCDSAPAASGSQSGN
jgi:hypothetical protein